MRTLLTLVMILAPAPNPPKDTWHAWVNLMPPGPSKLIVVGKVKNPGVGWRAELVPRKPQGINPKILLLDLKLAPVPVKLPNTPLSVEVRYETGPVNYEHVVIYYPDKTFQTATVGKAH